MWKEMPVAYFEVPSWHLVRDTEESFEKLHHPDLIPCLQGQMSQYMVS
jgi:hypothetical protein